MLDLPATAFARDLLIVDDASSEEQLVSAAIEMIDRPAINGRINDIIEVLVRGLWFSAGSKN